MDKNLDKKQYYEYKSTISLIIITFLIGGGLGCLVPIEQDATVPALVLAGKIPVRPETALGQYFFGSWTLINQVGAWLINLGFSQKALDYFYCFTLAGLRLSGYSMLIYGLSRWKLFSIVSATTIFLFGIFDQFFIPLDYSGGWSDVTKPHSGTYGGYAYALSAFIIGAISARQNYLAGVSSSILIAVHPVVGIYITFLLISIVFISQKIELNVYTKGIFRGLLIGIPIPLISLLSFLKTFPSGYKQPLDNSLYEVYLRYWDYHRSFPLHIKTVIATLLAGIILWSFLKITRTGYDSPRCAAMIMFVSVPISLFFYILIDSLPISWRYRFLPHLILQAMPNRLLAIHGILISPFLLGFTAYLYTYILSHNDAAQLNFFNTIKRIPKSFAPWIILSFFLVLEPFSTFNHINDLLIILKQRKEGILGLTTYGHFWRTVRKENVNFPVLVPPKLTQAAERGGHLPLLIEPDNIDFIPYKPKTVKEIAQIFEMAYGISFVNPPIAMRHWGGLSGHGETGHALWEKMSTAQWINLSKTLNIGGVITPAGWKLHLPILINDKEFIFYSIGSSEIRAKNKGKIINNDK